MTITPADVIALGAAAIAVISLYVSWLSYRASTADSARGAKRDRDSREMELFDLWLDMHRISATKPIASHVVRAHRAMAATARTWIEDPGNRPMLFEHFSADYIAQYEALRNCQVEVPGLKRKGSSLLTHQMGVAYGEMKIYKE